MAEPKPMLANELRERLRFQRKAADANGDRRGAWEDVENLDRVSAGITRLRRGEGVMQGRLQGQSPVVLRIRNSALARTIDNSWRALDVRTGEAFNLTSAGEPSTDRSFLDFLAIADASVA